MSTLGTCISHLILFLIGYKKEYTFPLEQT